MRPRPLVFALLLVAFGTAHAADPDAPTSGSKAPALDSQECGLSTPFNVLVDAGGVWLYREQGSPKEIFFHGGELSVDRKVRQVSAADAARLWQMEDQARQLMPQVAGLARGVVDVTFDALSTVVAQITGSRRKAGKVEGHRKDALDYIDGTLGKGRWDQEVFDEGFDKRVEDAAEQMATMLGRSALWQVMTGRGDAMDQRADRMDEAFDARMEARSDALEAQARALCPLVQSLYTLQSQLEFRDQGQPLRMIEMDGEGPHATPPTATRTDVPPDTSIKVAPAKR